MIKKESLITANLLTLLHALFLHDSPILTSASDASSEKVLQNSDINQ